MKNIVLKTPDRKIFSWLIITGLLGIALVSCIAFLVPGGFDDKVLALFSPHITAINTRIMLFFTFWGSYLFLIPANVLLVCWLWLQKKKQLAFKAALIALTSLGLMTVLKNWIGRVRPPHPIVDGVTNFGYPSGHAFMSIVFYGLLILLVAGFAEHTFLKKSGIVLLFLLILLIGVSRIYLRMHFPTDVLAGWVMGFTWLFLSLYLSDWLIRRYSIKTEYPAKN